MLADKIIILRKKAGWTQEEFASQLHVSRQSVSKWEGNQSIPDVDKILQMSQIFGVTVDYLLKDEIDEPEYLTNDFDYGDVRQVSLEEANEYLKTTEEAAKGIALGVVLCILSPVTLMLLLSAESAPNSKIITESISTGVGIAMVLLFVAVAVGLFIYNGLKTQKYEYLEQEVFETQYGVTQMVKDRKNNYQSSYMKMLISGVILCILSALPLFIVLMFTEADHAVFLAIAILLLIVSSGVYLLVRSGMRWESYLKLLQEGDYTRQKKRRKGWVDAIFGAYWLLVVTGFLGYSFVTNNWGQSWIIFPVAGVFFGIIALLVEAIGGKE